MLGQSKKISGGNLKNNDVKKQSQKNERQIAKKLGGVTTPGSGAFEGHKGDIKLKDFLLELKETNNLSIPILAEHLMKIRKEAIQTGKEGCMIYKFNTVKELPKEWILIPLDLFRELIGE